MTTIRRSPASIIIRTREEYKPAPNAKAAGTALNDLPSGDFFFDQPKNPRSPESVFPDFESDREGGRCFHMGHRVGQIPDGAGEKVKGQKRREREEDKSRRRDTFRGAGGERETGLGKARRQRATPGGEHKNDNSDDGLFAAEGMDGAGIATVNDGQRDMR
ncbi:hypothetical protein BJX63DRAFT_53047 [Aspergillus granulosus]|uniref:Uncharacterized protein n=1 Tax=Aspergillus granulosus TaxID=176169 RepID=A0ABR4GYI0_9EURO